MPVIAFATHKGGVGKTTLTVHMAYYLTQKGYRVAVIDADPQGNTTSWVAENLTGYPGFWQVVVARQPILDVERWADGWGFYVLPGNFKTAVAMEYMTIDHAQLGLIRKLIQPLVDHVDYVLIDTPPTRGANYEKVLYAADWLIVPTQLERFSLEGIKFMADLCVELQGHPKLLGIVPNMTDRTQIEHKQNMAELLDKFGSLVWPDIPASARIPVTQSLACTVWDLPRTKRVRTAFDLIGERLVENAKAK